jgi:hypothetical protein
MSEEEVPLLEISRHLLADPSAFVLLVLGFFLGVLELSSSSSFGRFGGTGGICIKNGTGMTCGMYGCGGRYASIPGTGLGWRGSPPMVRTGRRAFSQGSLPEASPGVGGPVAGRGDSGGL